MCSHRVAAYLTQVTRLLCVTVYTRSDDELRVLEQPYCSPCGVAALMHRGDAEREHVRSAMLPNEAAPLAAQRSRSSGPNSTVSIDQRLSQALRDSEAPVPQRTAEVERPLSIDELVGLSQAPRDSEQGGMLARIARHQAERVARAEEARFSTLPAFERPMGSAVAPVPQRQRTAEVERPLSIDERLSQAPRDSEQLAVAPVPQRQRTSEAERPLTIGERQVALQPQRSSSDSTPVPLPPRLQKTSSSMLAAQLVALSTAGEDTHAACCICLEPLHTAPVGALMRGGYRACAHYVHLACAKQLWGAQQRNCPMCRAPYDAPAGLPAIGTSPHEWLRIADTGNTGKLSQTEVAAALASQYPLDEAKLRAMLADRRIRDDSAGSPGRRGGDGDGPSRAARQRSRGAGDSGGSGGSGSRQRPSALWSMFDLDGSGVLSADVLASGLAEFAQSNWPTPKVDDAWAAENAAACAQPSEQNARVPVSHDSLPPPRRLIEREFRDASPAMPVGSMIIDEQVRQYEQELHREGVPLDMRDSLLRARRNTLQGSRPRTNERIAYPPAGAAQRVRNPGSDGDGRTERDVSLGWQPVAAASATSATSAAAAAPSTVELSERARRVVLEACPNYDDLNAEQQAQVRRALQSLLQGVSG